jgi:hypothetical protein
MSKEFDSVNRKIEIKDLPKFIKKQIGRMVHNGQIEEAEQIQRDYVNRKPDKEFDLYRVEVKQSSKSKRKEVSHKKAAHKDEEVKKVWEDDKNRPDHIRSRIDKYFNNILEGVSEIYPKEKKVLEEIFIYPDDKAREEIAKYENVAPEKRKEELNTVEFFRNRFREKEKTTDQNERTYKTLGIYRWFFLLGRIYREDLETFFNVDGAGKTILDKVISGVRQEVAQKKK